MPTASREEIRRGIVYMVGAVFVFGGANALAKWLVVRYPVIEIAFFRCWFALVPCLILVATRGGFGGLRTSRLPEHVGRALIQFLSMLSIFTAYRLMPLADAVAITFSSPLFLTVFSMPMLGEPVGPYRWAAVLVGFAGVLVMVPPGAGILEGGAAFALFNALASAVVTIAMRRMSVTEASTTLVFYQLAVTAVLASLLVPFGWVTPSWVDGAMLALVGIASGVAQFWWTQAFRLAPAAVAAPFSYTSMVWAIAFGYLIWGDVPTPAIVLGATIVIASGLFILYREAVRRVPVVRQPV